MIAGTVPMRIYDPTGEYLPNEVHPDAMEIYYDGTMLIAMVCRLIKMKMVLMF